MGEFLRRETELGMASELFRMDWDTVDFWFKNQGPKPKNQALHKNRCAEHCLAEMSTMSGIMKTYHVPHNEFTKRYRETTMERMMSSDLTPFVMYSRNKRRHWEIEASVDLMGEIQKLHPNEDVRVLERVAMRCRWPTVFRSQLLWADFRVTALHELNYDGSDRLNYKAISINSVFGQHLEHFEEHNRAPNKDEFIYKNNKKLADPRKNTIVAYHLIKPPENYSTIFKKQFTRKWLHPGRWKGAAYLERMRMEHIRELDIRYEEHLAEIDEDRDEESSDITMEKSSFYNLEDHIVVDRFVHVKRRKRKL